MPLLSFLLQTLESVDVHCFGHLLYEMTYGRPPDSVPVDSFPPAPSMAVGQYGVWRGLLGPRNVQSYSPSFQSPGKTQRKLLRSTARKSYSYKSNLSDFLKCISLKIQRACLFVSLSETSGDILQHALELWKQEDVKRSIARLSLI